MGKKREGKECAPDLSILNKSYRNSITERDLSRFDRESRVACCHKRRLKTKNIQNNMMLYKKIKIDRGWRKYLLFWVKEKLNGMKFKVNKSLK